MNTYIKKYKFDYYFTFLLTFVVMIVTRDREEIKIFTDHFGMLSSAAKLADYDWNEVLKLSGYYGPGFYIFFTPLLKYISNPVLLYNIIVDFSYAITAFAAVAMNWVMVNVAHSTNYSLNIISATVASIFSAWHPVIKPTGFGNEPIILFLSIILGVLLTCYLGSKSLFREILVLVIIDFVLIYSISVHIRNIVFTVGVVVILFSISLAKKNSLKTRILESLIALAGIIGAFICYLVFPRLFYGMFFSTDGLTDSVANISIQVIKTPIKETLTGIIYVLAGNVYQSIIQTYGLALFSYYYIVKVTQKYIKMLLHGVQYVSDEKSIDILFMFSSVLYLVGLFGISVSMHGSNRMSGCWRYYGTYSGLMLLLTIYYVNKEYSFPKYFKLICIPITLFLFKYLITIRDWITSGYDYLTFWFAFPYKDGSLSDNDLIITLLIVLLGITILLFFTKKMQIYALYILLFYVFLYFGDGGLLAFTSSEYCDASYELIQYLDNSKLLNVKTDIFYEGTNQEYLYLQWMLQGNPLHRAEATANGFVFSDTEKNLSFPYYSAWRLYQLDENEYVYVQDEILINEIDEYLEQRE